MTVICPKCRTGNTSGSKFCRECAAPLPLLDAPDATLPLTSGAGATRVAAGAPAEDFHPGTMFAGRFRIIEALGGGGMGRVYKAFDTKVGEKVALKRILPEIAADPDVLARFADELRLARRIAHPNVCRMFDIGDADGAPFISMEYVAGEDLKNIIRMTKGLSPGQAAGIGRQVAAGLAEAHRLGVVHRDLKPQNIMIDREGTARIMDFGIARLARAQSGRTGRGVMIGTPDYMSPEQAGGEEIDARADLYSLGVMLFEMATGRLPFEAPTAVAVAVKHKTEAPSDPRGLNPRIPDDLARLILRLLEKDRSARIQTAEEVRDELERIEKEVPATVPVVASRVPSTAREITLSVAKLKKFAIPAAVIILVAAGVLLVGRFPPRRGGGPAAPKIPNSIAVVGFENQTGDPKFDHLRKAIPELIITNLENMGRFQVTTWERMQDVLKLAGRGVVEVIDSASGFEVCRKEGVAVLVTGSFTKAGDTFATNVKVLDAETRKSLKNASSRGEGENSILRTQIDELSGEIARRLVPAGAPAAVPVFSVTDVTTNSMEAYAAYLRGRDGYERYRYNDASVDLERAVALDPAFATAHYYLARIYRNLGNLQGTVEHFERAKANAAKASEKERLWIQAGYAGYVEQNGEKQIAILRGAVKAFPREKAVWLDMANSLNYGGRYDEAVAAYGRALELDPTFGGALNQLAYCYLAMGRYEEAAECLRKYAAFYPGDINPIDSLAEVDYSRGRLAEAEAGYRRVVAADPAFGADIRLAWMQALQEKYSEALETLRTWAARATTDVEKFGSHLLQGIVLHLAGRERESREALRAGRELAIASRMTDIADLVEGWLAFDRGDWAGSRAALRRMAVPALAEASSRILIPTDPVLLEAIVDVSEGRLASARARSAAVEKARTANPKAELTVEEDLRELLRARILAAEGNLDGARAILSRERPVPLLFMSFTDLIAYICPLDRDDLARLSVRAGDWDQAIAAYKVLTVFGPEHKNRRPIHPIYHYRLAQLYEKKGMKAEAAAEYERFLRILEKADTERPEMTDARERVRYLR
jgi:serine/threonine protein kinase/tetratricopeptide (TPR) repeat protein